MVFWSGMFDSFARGEVDESRFVVQPAKRGLFRVTVREKGELDSLESVVLSNNTGESTTIVSIVPEGTLVEEGDLVIELDAVPVEEEYREQQVKLTNAEAALAKAEQSLEITRQQNESDIAAAELAKELAALDLEKYRDGDYPQSVQTLEDEIAVAEEDLIRKGEDYEFSKRMAKKGYKPLNEMEADRIAVKQAEITRNSARQKLKVLQEYERKRQIAELEENERETIRQLERIKAQTAAALAQAEADLKAAKLTFDVETSELDELTKQLEATKIFAPSSGEVVYIAQEGRRGEESTVEKGANVYPRQDLIKLPDLSRIKVDASIHESQISLVNTGLPATVRVDAYPDRIFRGSVISVSSVPVQGSWFRPDLKEYSATVELDPLGPNDPKLKPGLTCEIEILVEQRPDVLHVPVQAVVSVGGGRFVYALTPAGPRRSEVRIGVTNETDVEIKSGLEAGARIVMNPRSHFAQELDALEAQLEGERLARAAEEGGGEGATDSGDDAAAGDETPAEGGGKKRGGPGGGGKRP